jgi:hypothetical protein
MNWIEKGVGLIKRFDDAILFVGPRIQLDPKSASILNGNWMTIADVGASGELDPRWRSIRHLVRFFTFDPRPRERPAEPSV